MVNGLLGRTEIFFISASKRREFHGELPRGFSRIFFPQQNRSRFRTRQRSVPRSTSAAGPTPPVPAAVRFQRTSPQRRDAFLHGSGEHFAAGSMPKPGCRSGRILAGSRRASHFDYQVAAWRRERSSSI